MLVGLIIRLTSSEHLQSLVKFDYQIFFNVLLPPIILNSGYELHQVPFSSPSTFEGGDGVDANGDDDDDGIGEFLSQYRLYIDVCLRWDLHFGGSPWVCCGA